MLFRMKNWQSYADREWGPYPKSYKPCCPKAVFPRATKGGVLPLTKPCAPLHSRKEKSRSLLRPVSMVTSQQLTMWRQLGLLKGKIFNRDQATERPKKGQLIPMPLEEAPGITAPSLYWEEPSWISEEMDGEGKERNF